MVIRDNLFIKNFSIYFFGLCLSGLVSFFTIPLLIKLYGIEKYGIFSLIQNVILIFISFGGGWLNQCVIRLNDYSQKFKVIIYQLCFIMLIPLIVIYSIVIQLLKFDLFIFFFGNLTMILGIVSLLSIAFHQSKLNAIKSFYFDLIRIISFVIINYLLFIFFSKYNTLWLIFISFFLSYFLSFLFVLKIDYYFLRVSIKFFFRNFNFRDKLKLINEKHYLLQYGWPIALWFSVSAILNVSDRYIIRYYVTDNDLGTYSAIYDLLYKGVTLLYSPILVAGYPIMTKKFNQGLKVETYKFLKKLIFFEFIIFFFIIVIAYFLKSFFIEKIVGIPLSAKSLGIVIPIICGAFVWQLAMLVHKPLEFELRTKSMLIAVFIALLFNIILNLIFVPKYGILFAAYSTLFAAIIYLIIILVMIREIKS